MPGNIIHDGNLDSVWENVKRLFGNLVRTISRNGVPVEMSSEGNVDISVPTKTSDLENDSGFVDGTAIEGKVSKTGDTMTGDLGFDSTGSIFRGANYWMRIKQDGAYFDFANSTNEGTSWTDLLKIYNTQGKIVYRNSAIYLNNDTSNSQANKVVIFGDLGSVATSNDYNDLDNLPTIPTQVQSDWNQSDTAAVDYIKNKPILATVATTGRYDDLLDKTHWRDHITQPSKTLTESNYDEYVDYSYLFNDVVLTASAILGSTIEISENGTTLVSETLTESNRTYTLSQQDISNGKFWYFGDVSVVYPGEEGYNVFFAAFMNPVSMIVWSENGDTSIDANTLEVGIDDWYNFEISLNAIDEYVYHVLDDNYISDNIARISDLPSLAGYATETYVGTAIGTHDSANDAHSDIRGLISVINEKIPSAASSSNQLADKAFVNSSISTNTAAFQGTYNSVSDLSLTTAATHSDIATALGSEISGADANDYCFVQIPTSDTTPTEIESTERYKFVTGTGWQYEYTLNNSGFTAAQWAAINSGITTGLVTQIRTSAEDITTIQSAITQLNTDVSGKVSKTGDTMTGALLLDTSNQINWIGAYRGSSGISKNAIWFRSDGAGVYFGYLNSTYTSPSTTYARIVNDGLILNGTRGVYTTNTISDATKCLNRTEGDVRWLQINPDANTQQATLVAGIPNIYSSVDYAALQLPQDPGNAEYFGRFTSSTTGDITVSLPLTYWTGDTNIVASHTYEFSIQNGSGHIIMLA